jgi:hypothetical protein
MLCAVSVVESDGHKEVEVVCPALGIATTNMEGWSNEVVDRISAPQENAILKPVVTWRKCTNSCPPRAARSSVSRPWSVEWLNDHVHDDTGIVSSSKKNINKMVKSNDGHTHCLLMALLGCL